MSEPKRIFTALADALFCEPKGFKLTTREFQGTTLLVCEVKRQFYGRIIGSGGKVFQALQIVTCLAGRKAGKAHALQVLDVPKEGKPDRLPFVPALDWNNEWLRALAHDLCTAAFHTFSLDVEDTAEATTSINIVTSDTLPLPEHKVAEALSTIFNAIGKANGREVNTSFKLNK